MSSAEHLRLMSAMARQSERAAAAAGPTAGIDNAGPPYWDRQAWDNFKAQYGHYPFGYQADASFINPPTFNGAPDWVYEYMWGPGTRPRPIQSKNPGT